MPKRFLSFLSYSIPRGQNVDCGFKLLIFLVLLFSWNNSRSQNYKNETLKNITYYTTNDGLSQNEVTAIVKDDLGFLWIGTRGGLSRFDGSNFKVYQPIVGNNNSLSSASIETIFKDSRGQLWIGTKTDGLSKYNPIENRFEHFYPSGNNENGIHGTRVISITEGKDGAIWAGTWENGISIINTENGSSRHILPLRKINALITLQDGTIWAGTPQGLYVLSKDGKQLALYKPYNLEFEFNGITFNKQSNELLLSSWKTGLFTFNLGTKLFGSIPLVKKAERGSGINSYFIHADADNNIWLGSWGFGLKKYEPSSTSVTSFDLGNQNRAGSEIYKDIISIYKDDLGILWLGTNGGGLCKIDPRKSQFESSIETNLPKEPIWSILNDDKNDFWVGFKGIRKLYYSRNGIEYSTIPIRDEKQQDKDGFKTIYQDRTRNIWAATNGDLFRIVSEEHHYGAVPVNLTNNSDSSEIRKITALYQTTDGVFWVGTQQQGLFNFTLNIQQPFSQSLKQIEKKSNDRITSFLEDIKGNLWIGTYAGLLKYNKNRDTYQSFHKEIENLTSLSSNIVICIFEDSKERLWIGTPSGLNLKTEKSDGEVYFEVIEKKDGLPDNYINSILEDDSGNLWIGTNKGIAKFNTDEKVITTYDVTDGLQSNSFMENVAVKDERGKFYFGGTFGLSNFHPDSIKRNVLPKVVFTKLRIQEKDIEANQYFGSNQVLNKSIEYADKVNLSFTQNTFSLFYTAINYQATGQFSFRYKLKGVDNQWNTSVTKENITYSNLEPGEYTFRLKVIDEEGRSGTENQASLAITVLPPLWRTWQAYALYAFLFVILLYSYDQYAKRQNELKTNLEIARYDQIKEKELAEMKSRFFTNIAHELRTPLALISGPIEAMMQNDVNDYQQKQFLSTLHYNSQRLLKLVSQLLDFRKSESGKMKLQAAEGNLVNFTKEIFLSFRELADSKFITYDFKIEEDSLLLSFDRNKMEIVFCNLLSNAFKYTPKGGEINLLIVKNVEPNSDFPEGYVQISVEDNGLGMSEELLDKIFDRFYQVANTDTVSVVGSGIGLALAKNIVELHKGKILVESKPNMGSTFSVRLHLGQSHFSEDQLNKNYVKSDNPIHYRPEKLLKDRFVVPESNLGNDSFPTLLIVEDNPEIRIFIKTIFESEFKIEQAVNGEDGLIKAKKCIPDIIISDLTMPVMDGLTLCAKLRSLEETLQIPIILLTARTSNVFQEKGYGSGADVYVTKPFHPAVLKAQVEGLIQSRVKLKEYFSKRITLQPTEIEITSLDEKFLERAIKVIEENISNSNLNRELFASEMAMSPSTLYRKLKGLTGYDTTLFIRSIRLKRAAQIICKNNNSISEVAYQVGFNDLKYFSKCFKKQFGVIPSKFPKKENLM